MNQSKTAKKNECQRTKINLDKCSSPYLDIINQRLKYPDLFIKWVVQM